MSNYAGVSLELTSNNTGILRNVIVTGNKANFHAGIGFFKTNDASASFPPRIWIYDSTISNNLCNGDGAGLAGNSMITIIRSSIFGNRVSSNFVKNFYHSRVDVVEECLLVILLGP